MLVILFIEKNGIDTTSILISIKVIFEIIGILSSNTNLYTRAITKHLKF